MGEVGHCLNVEEAISVPQAVQHLKTYSFIVIEIACSLGLGHCATLVQVSLVGFAFRSGIQAGETRHLLGKAGFFEISRTAE